MLTFYQKKEGVGLGWVHIGHIVYKLFTKLLTELFAMLFVYQAKGGCLNGVYMRQYSIIVLVSFLPSFGPSYLPCFFFYKRCGEGGRIDLSVDTASCCCELFTKLLTEFL